jgi:hypothetical protein
MSVRGFTPHEARLRNRLLQLSEENNVVFEVGTRVILCNADRVDHNAGLFDGALGTVVERDDVPYVKWDSGVVRAVIARTQLRLAPAEPARIATPAEMASIHRNVLPTDAAARNAIPMADGCLDYFPNALAAVAALSKVANEQHNPGEPMHWARNKSTDHRNKILKHLVDAGCFDTDGQRHSAKVAWRALALLEDELIAAGAVPGRNAIGAPEVLSASQQRYRAQHAANVAADAAFHNCIEDEV